MTWLEGMVIWVCAGRISLSLHEHVHPHLLKLPGDLVYFFVGQLQAFVAVLYLFPDQFVIGTVGRDGFVAFRLRCIRPRHGPFLADRDRLVRKEDQVVVAEHAP
jgi:hypothetical protein